MNTELLTSKEVMEILKISYSTLYRMVKSGKLSVIKVTGEDGKPRYRKSEIDHIVEGGE